MTCAPVPHLHVFELRLADTLEEGVASGDAQIASRVYGFDSTDTIVTVLLIFAFTMLLLLVVILAVLVRQQGRVPTIRLTENHQEPELTLGKCKLFSPGSGQRFHLFLSHIWGTGQDQVGVDDGWVLVMG